MVPWDVRVQVEVYGGRSLCFPGKSIPVQATKMVLRDWKGNAPVRSPVGACLISKNLSIYRRTQWL
jgi:hypothetical protein